MFLYNYPDIGAVYRAFGARQHRYSVRRVTDGFYQNLRFARQMEKNNRLRMLRRRGGHEALSRRICRAAARGLYKIQVQKNVL